LKNSNSKDFKLFTTIKKIIDNLFNYLGGAGQAGAKPGHVSIMSDTRQSLAYGGASV